MKRKLILTILFLCSAGLLQAMPVNGINRAVKTYLSNDSSALIGYSPSNLDDGSTYSRRDTIPKAINLTQTAPVQRFIDLLVQRKQQIGKLLGLSDYYFPVYEKVLSEFGLPEELKFLSVIESALNPHAVSRSGATGPWQFMAPTAKAYGLAMNKEVDERKDPLKASRAAAAYLKDAFAEFDDWLLAIASYNCGRGAVSRAIARAGGQADFWKISPFLPAETRNYVPKFIATAYIMSNYKQYDINPLAPSFNTFTDVYDIIKPISLAAVARATGIDLQQLLTLNPSYKNLIIKGSVEVPKPLVLPVAAQPDYAALYKVLNSASVDEATVSSATTSKSNLKKTVYHVVKKGESLSLIAKKFTGVTAEEIKRWNGLRSSGLKPGMRLKIHKN
ncbi:MAG: transglycosylase SLT domain-containing protein [Sphingobacteriaceae bacterium]